MTKNNRIKKLKKGVPGDLRRLSHWVVWRKESRDGKRKPEKVPYTPGTSKRAEVNNPQTWSSFRDAVQGWLKGDVDGVGYVLTRENGLICIDLDDCRNPKSGDIQPWATKIVNSLKSYTEISPSGRGVHIWVKAKLPEGPRRKQNIEIYGDARYMTVTGRHLKGTPREIKRDNKTLTTFYSDIFCEQTSRNDANHVLLGKIKAAEDEKFRKFYEGDARLWGKSTQYSSQSEADLGLCRLLVKHVGFYSRTVDQLFRRSRLYRPKWDECHSGKGRTYGEMTIGKAIASSDKTHTMGLDNRRLTIPLSEVKAKRVRWLWDGWIPRGKLTLLEGDPGVGKSTLTLAIAANVTHDWEMPDGGDSASGNAVICNAEDDLEDTIKPRLKAAVADLQKCSALPLFTASGEKLLRIPADLQRLEDEIVYRRAVLVVLDPFSAFLDRTVNSWKDQHVRGALAPLAAVAKRTGAAIVLVRHRTKDETKKNPLYRGQGSIAFIGAARAALVVERDEQNPQKLLLRSIKTNLGPAPTPLSYEIVQTKKGVAKIHWLGQVDQPAGSYSVVAQEQSSALEEAKQFLQESLSLGRAPMIEVVKDAKQVGISITTLRRAKKKLRIRSKRKGFGPKSEVFWEISNPNLK